MSHLLKKIPYPIYRLVRPLMERIRNRKAAQLYGSFAGKGELCFDVGANVGNRLDILLRLGCRVVAIEPQARLAAVLQERFGGNPRAVFLQKALGEREGESEIMISDADTVSSLSKDWIAAVKGSGRFASISWDKTQKVSITTLDKLIAEHGVPAFIKIDVEGYEYEVLKGLTRPVPMISFEFVPEYIEKAFLCVDHLEKIENAEFNYSLFEEMTMKSPDWVKADALKALLSQYKDPVTFGDVYARSRPAR